MLITARPATEGDAAALLDLYAGLEAEMVALKPIWALVDGLPTPVDAAIKDRLADDDWHLYLGEIDGSAIGFLMARDEPTLPQGEGQRVASIRLIYTAPEARQVGVGEALIERFLADAADRGITVFDAHVSPGQRHTKNFFEAHGFKARSIVMHREDSNAEGESGDR